MKIKCAKCKKPIEWKMNWIRELRQLFRRGWYQKLCWDCYNKHKWSPTE